MRTSFSGRKVRHLETVWRALRLPTRQPTLEEEIQARSHNYAFIRIYHKHGKFRGRLSLPDGRVIRLDSRLDLNNPFLKQCRNCNAQIGEGHGYATKADIIGFPKGTICLGCLFSNTKLKEVYG